MCFEIPLTDENVFVAVIFKIEDQGAPTPAVAATPDSEAIS